MTKFRRSAPFVPRFDETPEEIRLSTGSNPPLNFLGETKSAKESVIGMQINNLTLRRILAGKTLEFFELRRHPRDDRRFALIKLHWHSLSVIQNDVALVEIALTSPESRERETRRVVKWKTTSEPYVCGGYADAHSALEAAYNAGAKRIDVATAFVRRIEAPAVFEDEAEQQQ